jgi:hypothetical protein
MTKEHGSCTVTDVRPVFGPIQPPIRWVPGVGFSPEVKRPGREADHSAPTIATIKNT